MNIQETVQSLNDIETQLTAARQSINCWPIPLQGIPTSTFKQLTDAHVQLTLAHQCIVRAKAIFSR